ncbi:MAG: methylmalonyl-CoA mutase [Pseudomonadales bacterium]|nr:methylmalonyl-CoA mutase [Pseudomonadales bacterium]
MSTDTVKSTSNSLQEWQDLIEQELRDKPLEELTRLSPEGISIKPLYTAEDIQGIEHLDSLPGVAPFKRGPRASMYTNRVWTIRQYAGFSTAEDSNIFYKANLAAGQKGLSVAFDLATHRGYDSDHERVSGDVGKAGVAIDSVEDMKILFDSIPLDKVSVSMTMNGAVLPVLGAFIVAAEEQGVERSTLSGTIQNDILKEFMVRNTYIYPPQPSMRIVNDIISYASAEMPRFNPISISGYHLQEAGANAVQELAFTLADGLEYVRAALKSGQDIDKFAPRLSFFFCIGMDFFTEIAKLRAARVLWCKLMQQFDPKKPASLMLRTHSQTSGVSLTAKDPYNNVMRTTMEALAAVLGGTQSLHTNALDEALALPTERSARIARNTQLILAEESGITHTIDPLAGSYFVEKLTQELVDKASALIDEIEDLGGMVAAISDGMPMRVIEEEALRRQSRFETMDSVVVGVNKYVDENEENDIELLNIDNDAVRQAQVDRLEKVRANRDNAAYEKSISGLVSAAKNNGNLLEAAVTAMRARATVGEVSDALEGVFTRYKASHTPIKNVYKMAQGEVEAFSELSNEISAFEEFEGRRPSMLVVKMGQDGHDRGAKVIASSFGDLGFSIHSGDLFQTAEEAAAEAVQRDVHVVGVSSLAGGHKTLVPEMIAHLRKTGNEHIMIVCGGIIPVEDHEFLFNAGVQAIYGPNTNILEAAREILVSIPGRNRNEAELEKR